MSVYYDLAVTLEDIGAELGLTRERVRQIEAVALAKYRIAYELDELLGPEAATELFAQLRGQGVHAYEAALRARQVRRAG